MPQGASHWQQYRPLTQGQGISGPTISPLHAMAGSFNVVIQQYPLLARAPLGLPAYFFWALPPLVIPLIIPAFIR